ncbi:response regulator transcription factor [Hydrotalea sandarakina]|jgi:DNA-binding NarL/FixJ family response regulator|uniref:LuxR family two component transcriptional regulator n=1 Tax=Hydrotalea sandarakina TaxID=1004304 RepID=A0A2W7RX55_9BACT|nr:response regulator transcription factor [Hydrotalea sandarakina]PZX63416.1 LuxR family two component transcriptional regulator [Hydrotalea sandarakina]
MESEIIRIALVDDHALFRSGIAALLKEFDDLMIVFEASNGKELQLLLPQHLPIDVVLMDIKMPGLNGFDTTEWISTHYPKTAVLALSMFDESIDIIKMLKAGAGGYLLKESSPEELYAAITAIHQNGFYSNELVSDQLIKSLKSGKHIEDWYEQYGLNQKELEFLRLCATELTYRQIAETMGVAERTVENYRQSLSEKLGIKNRVGLALFAIKNKLVSLGNETL